MPARRARVTSGIVRPALWKHMSCAGQMRSPQSARDFTAKSWSEGSSAEKVTVVPNAVDAEQFTMDRRADAELQRSLGLAGAIVLGFIGSFYAYEGLDLLIDAVGRLKRQRLNVKLLLVGGGPEQERLVAQATSLGLQPSVIFTGRVPHDAGAVLLRPGDCVRLSKAPDAVDGAGDAPETARGNGPGIDRRGFRRRGYIESYWSMGRRDTYSGLMTLKR